MGARGSVVGGGLVPKGRMAPVVVIYSCFQSVITTRAWVNDQKMLMLRHSLRMRASNDSMYPLRQGYPAG
jgi:hypothetical protein